VLLDRRGNNGSQFVEIVFGARHISLSSGALAVDIDDPDHPGDKLLRLLRENQIDLNVVEGLRLVVAFRKIEDPSDRRILIELAERLAK
jgi:hypothetical protein